MYMIDPLASDFGSISTLPPHRSTIRHTNRKPKPSLILDDLTHKKVTENWPEIRRVDTKSNDSKREYLAFLRLRSLKIHSYPPTQAEATIMVTFTTAYAPVTVLDDAIRRHHQRKKNGMLLNAAPIKIATTILSTK